jgi:hypothetical protein
MPMSKIVVVVVAYCLAFSACKRARTGPAAAPPGVDDRMLDLPAVIGPFAGGPLERQGGAIRRAYVRDVTRISVTLARFPMTGEQYESWVKTSTAGFPQATLDIPAEGGNGFYQCDGKGGCDLLVQLRSGVHLEIRGQGTATREDVNAIARELPLRALAADTGRAAAVSFRLDVAPVLASSCAAADGCHGPDPTHRVRMDLREGAAYLSLVGRPSELRPAALLVDPGHVERSFLVDKLTRNLPPKGEGRPMPLDPQTGSVAEPSPVEGFVRKTLTAWIAQGAPNN